MKIHLLFFSFFIILTAGVFAGEKNQGKNSNPQGDDLKISAAIQLRSELDGRDFSNKTHALTFASLRTRLGIEKSFNGKVKIFGQLQDSRVFGEEGNTLAATDNVDLHQGYVLLIEPFDLPVQVQAGRFEVIYGTERFFGAVGWHYVGRSWDGVRFSLTKGTDLELFALTHTETNGYIGNASTTAYPLPENPTPSYSVYGLWETLRIADDSKLDLFGYYQLNRAKAFGENLLSMFTLGTSYFGNYGAFSTIFEGAYQFGKAVNTDIAAYLLSLSGSYAFNSFKLGLGTDILSGTDAGSSKINTFNPAFGTNHKFYGYMDYFINIPVNTFGLGLNDFYFTAAYQPKESKLGGSLVVHHFGASKEAVDIGSSFGQEVDLTISYKFIEKTTINWGASLFFPGDLMKAAFSTPTVQREDPAFWSYVMISAAL